MKTLLRSVHLLFLTFVLIDSASTQITIDADIMSRYIWRGLDFGNAVSLQPALSFRGGNFKIGVWGAYSIGAVDNEGFAESDLWASYSIPTPGGEFSFVVTDYYFPSNGYRYFDYDKDGRGAHTLEYGIGYTGPESFPIGVFAYANFYNDPDNSVYISLNYPWRVVDTDMHFYIGGTPSANEYYGTERIGILELGIGALRNVAVTESFSVPVQIFFTVNPYHEQSYLVIGISF
jgi:hypothetical protein